MNGLIKRTCVLAALAMLAVPEMARATTIEGVASLSFSTDTCEGSDTACVPGFYFWIGNFTDTELSVRLFPLLGDGVSIGTVAVWTGSVDAGASLNSLVVSGWLSAYAGLSFVGRFPTPEFRRLDSDAPLYLAKGTVTGSLLWGDEKGWIDMSVEADEVTAVPEPATIGLLGCGVVAAFVKRRFLVSRQ